MSDAADLRLQPKWGFGLARRESACLCCLFRVSGEVGGGPPTLALNTNWSNRHSTGKVQRRDNSSAGSDSIEYGGDRTEENAEIRHQTPVPNVGGIQPGTVIVVEITSTGNLP